MPSIIVLFYTKIKILKYKIVLQHLKKKIQNNNKSKETKQMFLEFKVSKIIVNVVGFFYGLTWIA